MVIVPTSACTTSFASPNWSTLTVHRHSASPLYATAVFCVTPPKYQRTARPAARTASTPAAAVARGRFVITTGRRCLPTPCSDPTVSLPRIVDGGLRILLTLFLPLKGSSCAPGPFYLGLDIPFNECESTVFRADEYPPLPSPPRITLRPSDTWGGWHQFALLRSLDLCVKTVDAQPSSPPHHPLHCSRARSRLTTQGCGLDLRATDMYTAGERGDVRHRFPCRIT